MTFYPLPRNPMTGDRIPRGRVSREVAMSTLATQALPTTLAHTPSGAATVGDLGLTNGAITLTATAAAPVAEVTFLHDLSLTRYRALEWTVEGLTFDTATQAALKFEFGFRANNNLPGPGVAVIQNATLTAQLAALTDPQVTQETDYQITGTNARNARNLTLRLGMGLPARGIWLLSDDQLLASWKYNFTTGPCFPYLRLTTLDGTTHSCSFLQLRLRAEDNRPLP